MSPGQQPVITVGIDVNDDGVSVGITSILRVPHAAGRFGRAAIDDAIREAIASLDGVRASATLLLADPVDALTSTVDRLSRGRLSDEEEEALGLAALQRASELQRERQSSHQEQPDGVSALTEVALSEAQSNMKDARDALGRVVRLNVNHPPAVLKSLAAAQIAVLRASEAIRLRRDCYPSEGTPDASR